MKIRITAGLLVVLLVWGRGVCSLFVNYCGLLRHREWLDATLKASGRFGPLIFVVIQTGQVLIPGTVALSL